MIGFTVGTHVSLRVITVKVIKLIPSLEANYENICDNRILQVCIVAIGSNGNTNDNQSFLLARLPRLARLAR